VTFNLFTILAIGPILGQSGQSSARVEIPYRFTLASKTLEAGTYGFSVTSTGLRVQSPGGATFQALVITRLGGPAELFRDGALVFDTTGGQRTLSEIWIPGTDGILLHSTPKNHTHDVLLFPDGNASANLSGSAAYERTCRKCHGPDGLGDERADKFFSVKVPRLSSAEVQGKSDAELREIITKGSRAMDPVEIDEAGFRHRLGLQSVDSVIAYIRTLKH
jgi:hypothetical protein